MCIDRLSAAIPDLLQNGQLKKLTELNKLTELTKLTELRNLAELTKLTALLEETTSQNRQLTEQPPLAGGELTAGAGETDMVGRLRTLVEDPLFARLMSVHNTIQLVQCFRCPPPALCTDARDLVQEV